MMKSFEDLNSAAFQKKLKETANAVLLDVRTVDEHRSGHIPNSKNIDVMGPDFRDAIQKLDKEKTYFVYCRSGGRSGQACALMSSIGLHTVNLAGGMMGWTGEVV